MYFVLATLIFYAPTSHGFEFEIGAIPVCVFSTGAGLDEIRTLLDGGPRTRSASCFLKCVGEKTGVIQNGNLHPEKLSSVPMIPKQSLPDLRKCLEDNRGHKIIECEDVEYVAKCWEVIHQA